MDIREFISGMEGIAPPALADEFDEGKIGLVVEGRTDIGRIFCSLDASIHAVGEAVRGQADVLVVHHTPIFHPVTSVRGPLMPLLRTALSSGMNVYVMHTNFDRAPGGINDTLAELLGLCNAAPMKLGIVGDCRLKLEEIRNILGCELLVWGKLSSPRRLAVVGGSGFDADLIDEAVTLGADAFLSAEPKHSVIRNSPVPLIQATHYALEAPAMKALSGRMGWTFIEDPPAMVIVP
ncbi:MAG TPA: Nif3-like dinuclear metal center hexameric protein [Methanoregulaceae archaeon]|nr:Nif3-like dinuclear metal center hexameric protein [Methanoregulaceae archaeon]